MKRALLFLMSVIMVLSVYAQNSTTIKSFEYPDYLCSNPYTGKPIYGGSTLKISYSEKKSSFGIEFGYGYMKYSLSLSYKGMDNGRYVYTGFEIGNMAESIVATSVKLSRFLNNYGQAQNDKFENDKLIEVQIGNSESLSIYPIKDTPERRKRMEERELKRKVENEARNRLEEYYPYGIQHLQNSLKQQVIKEFFDNGGEVKSFNLEPYSSHTYVAVVDTNKQVTVIQKDDVVLNDELQNEQLHGEIEYRPLSVEGKTAKVINGKVFFSMSFRPELKVKEYRGKVIYDKNGFSYFENTKVSYAAPNRFTPTEDMKKMIETSITKKGQYSLYWEMLDNRLVYLSYKKIGTGILKAYEAIELYSIYK